MSRLTPEERAIRKSREIHKIEVAQAEVEWDLGDVTARVIDSGEMTLAEFSEAVGWTGEKSPWRPERLEEMADLARAWPKYLRVANATFEQHGDALAKSGGDVEAAHFALLKVVTA